MKKTIMVILFVLFASSGLWANQTRLDVLMTNDLVDDVVLIDQYPNHIIGYANALFGDIAGDITDYGITITPKKKFGALAFWQNADDMRGFNIGYAVTLMRFDVGISVSPVTDHYRYAFGIGRTYFSKRFDLSVQYNDDIAGQWFDFAFRCTRQKGDFVIVPRYALSYVTEPDEYQTHRIALLVQRLVLSEGFVYLGGEYEFERGGAIDIDLTHFYAGLELPVFKKLVLLFGARETFTDGFESPVWTIQPGISMRLRDFRIDLHLNREWFFEDNVNILHSIGLDLNFGRF
jgi:hypothetical protein